MDGLLEGSWAAMRRKEMAPIVTAAVFVWWTLPQLLGHLDGVVPLRRWSEKLLRNLNPIVTISFPEFCDGNLQRSAAFVRIQAYLSATCGGAARCLHAELGEGKSEIVFSIDTNEEVVEVFEGVSLTWNFSVSRTKDPAVDNSPVVEKRSYILNFRPRHRRLIVDKYLGFVMEKGKEIVEARRQRKLFTNRSGGFCYEGMWNYVPFDHPATFETIAMDPVKKDELINDLLSFRKSKEYYARVGKAWKRGYLLYGPPGTGKSSLIAAMANLLEYDVYDLELTAVTDNSLLRGLLMEMTNKSIVVVEDIDCSLDLAGKRKTKNYEEEDARDSDNNSEESKVTLSGLLNFIDGIWSSGVGERIIVFTTNHVDQLDPALIRPGRMDMHIELSYCRFEAFKVLARNYLEVEEHPIFADIRRLIEEVDVVPADVAEHLMLGSRRGSAQMLEQCLQALLRNLEAKKTQEGTGGSGGEAPRSLSRVSSVATTLRTDGTVRTNHSRNISILSGGHSRMNTRSTKKRISSSPFQGISASLMADFNDRASTFCL